MTEEIKEILDRLERIDHKEYIAFEFADSATFYEMARCFEERKKMADYITNLQQENGNLKTNEQINVEVHNKQVEIIKDYKSRCEKAIEYINFVIKHYKEQLKTPIEDTYFDSDVNRKGYILSIIAYLQTILDILNGSDENE